MLLIRDSLQREWEVSLPEEVISSTLRNEACIGISQEHWLWVGDRGYYRPTDWQEHVQRHMRHVFHMYLMYF